MAGINLYVRQLGLLSKFFVSTTDCHPSLGHYYDCRRAVDVLTIDLDLALVAAAREAAALPSSLPLSDFLGAHAQVVHVSAPFVVIAFVASGPVGGLSSQASKQAFNGCT